MLYYYLMETTGNTSTSQDIISQEIIQIGCWEMLSNSVFESLVKPGYLVILLTL